MRDNNKDVNQRLRLAKRWAKLRSEAAIALRQGRTRTERKSERCIQID